MLRKCYVYKIVIELEGFFYIGSRMLPKNITNAEDDKNYYGSGRKMKEYFEMMKSIGKSKHAGLKKIIIKDGLTSEEADELEEELISANIDDMKCLNKIIHCPQTGAREATNYEKYIEKLKKTLASPSVKNRRSESQKNAWKNNVVRENHINAMHTEEYKEMRRNNALDFWNDEEYRKKQSASHSAYYSNPENRAKVSERTKKMWENPEIREKCSIKTKEALSGPEVKEKISHNSKENWKKPEYREKMAKRCLGKKWFNNGVKCILATEETLPEGNWFPGRIMKNMKKYGG